MQSPIETTKRARSLPSYDWVTTSLRIVRPFRFEISNAATTVDPEILEILFESISDAREYAR